MENDADWLMAQMPPEYLPKTEKRLSNRDRETAKEDAFFEKVIQRAETREMVNKAIARLALRNIPAEASWRDRALCQGQPAIFDSPTTREEIDRAKAFCNACTVSSECLTFALSLDNSGSPVWGGLTHAEILAIRRGRK